MGVFSTYIIRRPGRLAALALSSFMTWLSPAWAQNIDPHAVQVRRLADSPAGDVLIPPTGCTESADNGWQALGLTTRPSWVSPCVERRLRLTPAVAPIHAAVASGVRQYFANQGPGMSVGLSLDDGLFYSEGFGSSQGLNTPPPDEETTFRAGSISKLMTATTLSILIEDPAYNIALSDAADKYIPQLAQLCPSADGTATCLPGAIRGGIKLRHLVSHTSGLPDGIRSPDDVYELDSRLLKALGQTTLLFPPGAYTAYSNTGAAVVGMIVGQVSKLGYAETVRQRLFEPLGMWHSWMDPRTSPPGLQQATKWKAHERTSRLLGPLGTYDFTATDTIEADKSFLTNPAGGLSTSIRDLSRFSTMWLTRRAPWRGGRRILSPATIEAAKTPFFNDTGDTPSYCAAGAFHMQPKPITSGSFTFDYASCGTAANFSAGWDARGGRFIQHNGDIGVSGGTLIVDMDSAQPIAAMTLVSTLPFPERNPGNAYTQASENVMKLALKGEADAKSIWSGQRVSIGVARLLWLSGARPPARIVHRLRGPNVYRQSLLSQFSPQYQAAHQISEGNVEAHVRDLFSGVRDCSTFRIRGADDEVTYTVRLSCDLTVPNWHGSFDATLKVDEQGRIDRLDNVRTPGGIF